MHHLRIEVLRRYSLPTSQKKKKKKQKSNQEMETEVNSNQPKSETQNEENYRSTEKKETNRSKQKPKIHFFAGNPSVEVIEGIVHLYKNDNSLISKIPGERDQMVTVGSGLPVNRTLILCVLSVPSYMSPADFASFTGPYHKNISNMRIVRYLFPLSLFFFNKMK